MKKFQFRLQPVMRLREAARDERRQELADALAVEANLREQMRAIEREQQSARHGYTATVGAVNVDRLLESQRYATVLELQRRMLDRQLADVAAEIDKRRQAVVEADREVKTVEKLRETQAQRWRFAAERKDQVALDEIAAQRFVRQEVT